MIFIGIDLSMTTGMVAIDEDDPFSGVKSWIIKPNTKSRGIDHYESIGKKIYITEQIITKLESLFESKIIIGIEGYSFSKFGMAESGELGGIVKSMLWNKGFEYSIFPPTSIKKFACGSGAAKKELMIAAVYKRWAFDTNDNNLADAFAVAKLLRAVHYYKQDGFVDGLTDFQLQVVKNLVEPNPKKVKK